MLSEASQNHLQLKKLIENAVNRYCIKYNLPKIPVGYGLVGKESGLEFNIRTPKIVISRNLPSRLRRHPPHARVWYMLQAVGHELTHYKQYTMLIKRHIVPRKELFDEEEAYLAGHQHADDNIVRYSPHEINPPAHYTIDRLGRVRLVKKKKNPNLHIKEAYPYGAPMLHVRGKATYDPKVREFLKHHNFHWDTTYYAWVGVNFNMDYKDIERRDNRLNKLTPDLKSLGENLGHEVFIRKSGENPIKHTPTGWYWGSQGPFPTRDKALNVMRAVFASGYTPKHNVTHDEKRSAPRSKLFEAFHGVQPQSAKTVFYEAPDKSKPLLKIGDISQLNYRPTGPSLKKGTEFYHKSGDTGNRMLKTNLILATDQKGKNLYLLKKSRSKYPVFTSRGVIG